MNGIIHPCLPAGTLVNLADGTALPIEEVPVGAEVLSYYERRAAGETDGLVVRQVTATLDQGLKPCVELLFQDGRTLVCTPDHLIRTADGRWMRADALTVGSAEVLVGVEHPHVTRAPSAVTAAAAGAWRLGTQETIGYDLNMAERAAHSLAFARLLGYAMTDGSVDDRSRLFLCHQLDADAVLRDVRLLINQQPPVRRGNRTLDITIPAPIHQAFLRLGVAQGSRHSAVVHFPAFVTAPSCPVPVVREFLGGLFGGDGRTMALKYQAKAVVLNGLSFATGRSGDVAAAQQAVLQVELFALLQRAGVDCSSDVTPHFTTSAPCCMTTAGAAMLKRKKEQSVTVQPRRTADTLDAARSYRLGFDFGNALVIPFARCVGFRYCCHKQQRLSAAVACFLGNERLMEQKQQLSARILELRGTMSIPAAARRAQAEMGLRELLLPDSAAWRPRQDDQLHSTQKRGGTPLIERLRAMDAARFFSAPKTTERYSAAKRQAELLGAAAAAASPASTEDDDSTSTASPAKRRRAVSEIIAVAAAGAGWAASDAAEMKDDKKIDLTVEVKNDAAQDADAPDPITYGVHIDARVLPLFRVKLVGRRNVGVRHVYDLTVPSPQAQHCSFVANGVVVHNCCHPEDAAAPDSEQEMIARVFAYIDRIVAIVRPRQLLYMAIDGVAPRAKMNQQRSRRFRTAKEMREKEELEARLRSEWEAQGRSLPPQSKKAWDSNVITPGTHFMHQLSIGLHYYIADRLQHSAGWKPLKVLFSDARVPGEGEHKIMRFIRNQRAQPGYNPNTSHCFPESDTRLLTSHGLLFLDEIEQRLSAGTEVLYGCYDKETKALVYSEGELVILKERELPQHLVEFTSPGEHERWAEGSGPYGTGLPLSKRRSSKHVSLRVTPDHRMFVQTGLSHPVTARRTGRKKQRVSWTPEPHAEVEARQLLQQDCQCPPAQPGQRECKHRRAHVRMLACAETGYVQQVARFTSSSSTRDNVKGDLGLKTAAQFNAFLELFGFWLGDGSMQYRQASNGSNAVAFHQVELEDRAWLKRSCAMAGLKGEQCLSTENGYSESFHITEPSWHVFFDQEFGAKSQQSQYHSAAATPPSVTRSLSSSSSSLSIDLSSSLSSSDDAEEREEADIPPPERTKPVKRLPDWVLTELSAAEMRLLINGLWRADGSWAGQQKEICTSSARFRDQLMQALLHCGYSAYADLMYREGAVRGYTFHDQSKDRNIYSQRFVNSLASEEEKGRYRPVRATADQWRVSWTAMGSSGGRATCWPSMPRQQHVTRVDYSAQRDGRVWCVQVAHQDHLIVAQRAERHGGVVTKQSRPIVVRNCLYGMDADLIMLGLATHEPYFRIIREMVTEPVRRCLLCGQEGHYMSDCKGEARVQQAVEDEKGALRPFQFLHINILREYLQHDLQVTEPLPFAWELERVVDDFVFLCVAEGTPVAVPSLGLSLRIEDVQEGCSVLALSEDGAGLVSRQVRRRLSKASRRCVELLFQDGRTLVCTPDHLIRTADGRWMRADALTVGSSQRAGSEVAVGMELPLFVDDIGEWRLQAGALSFGDLHALRFARLVGYVMGDGRVSSSGVQLSVEHELDVVSATADIRLLSGAEPEAIRKAGTAAVELTLPALLATAVHCVCGDSGAVREDRLTAVPAVFLAASCPVAVLREFLGGLFGSAGRTLRLQRRADGSHSVTGLALSCIRKDREVQPAELARAGLVSNAAVWLPDAQQLLLQQQLVPLLARCGVSQSVTTASRNVTKEVEQARADRRLPSDGQSYRVQLDIGAAAVAAFARCIGFRYSCHKQQRLTAGAACFRAAEYVKQQRSALIVRVEQLSGPRSGRALCHPRGAQARRGCRRCGQE